MTLDLKNNINIKNNKKEKTPEKLCREYTVERKYIGKNTIEQCIVNIVKSHMDY